MFVLKNWSRILLSWSLAVVGSMTLASPVAAQARELVLVLAPEPRAQEDMSYALEFATEARVRLQNRLRHRLSFVTTDDICQLLRDSGFDCDHIVGATDAGRMAQAMGVDAYLIGELWTSAQAPIARFRIVDIGRSGLSGWMTVRGTAGDPPRAFAQTLVDSMLGQVRASEYSRECTDRRDEGDFEEALEDAHKAFGLYANHPSAAMCAAVVREAMGQPPDSQIPYYARAIRGDSLYDRPYQRLGQLYQATGDSVKALEAFRAQMYLTPDDRQRWRGVISGYMLIKAFEDAERIVDEWLTRNPGDMEFIQLKTRACFEGQRWDCAINALEQQYERNADLQSDTAFYGQIMAAAMAGENNDALLRWSGAGTQAFPDDADMWRARATALEQAGQAGEAIAAYERVLMLDPDDVASALLVAQAVLGQVTMDTLVPLDTAALAQAGEYMSLAAAGAQANADTGVMMNLAVMYYETGSQLVQTRLDIEEGVNWLQYALDNDVQQRLVEPANFFLGLGLVFMIFEFDPQIAAYVERFADLTPSDKAAACLLVAEEASMVNRGKQAMTIGAGLSEGTAQQMLGQYATFEQRIPQLREAFECR